MAGRAPHPGCSVGKQTLLRSDDGQVKVTAVLLTKRPQDRKLTIQIVL
jgi:hypothetical protein